ncbi:integrase core domain-containing protein, partial [Saccharothrix lopnurensis]
SWQNGASTTSDLPGVPSSAHQRAVTCPSSETATKAPVLRRPIESKEYTANLTAQAFFRHGLRRSMGATGICRDNSPAESLWSTFEHEHHYRHVYATKAELVAAIDKWITFYNSESFPVMSVHVG